MTWAVVPLKSPEQAKSRLKASLAPAHRRALFFSMAGHVLHTVRESPEISAAIVVTASEEIAEFAQRLGCRVIWQSDDAGTSSAFEAGVASACAEAMGDLLMLPGDLPLLSSAAVKRFMRPCQRSPSVTIAPDEAGHGTNALLCSPPNVIPMCFGPDSFHRHVAAARERGAALQIMKLPELAFDVDRQADLDRLPRRFQMATGLRERELSCLRHVVAEQPPAV
jgi:2-phospho-L-lactate guanylyltransferase